VKQLIDQWKSDEEASCRGWSFSYIAGRIKRQDLSWSYVEIARRFTAKAKNILDMGTGRGKIFSSLAPFPGRVVVTESHAPIIPEARKTLQPLGVDVVDISGEERGKLPFAEGKFNLVLNRHEFFKSKEIYRVMAHRGIFITQQVGGNDTADLAKEFNTHPRWPDWDLRTGQSKLLDAGFTIRKGKEWRGKIIFEDVGAIVYWLKCSPWIVKDFSVDVYRPFLEKLQKKIERGEKLEYEKERFLIIAKKP